jgi:translation elongation factor EF-4
MHYCRQVYRCMLKNGDEVKVDNPTELPDEGARDHILEPYVKWGPVLLLP